MFIAEKRFGGTMSSEATFVIEITTDENPEEVLMGLLRLLAWNNHVIEGAVCIDGGGYLP